MVGHRVRWQVIVRSCRSGPCAMSPPFEFVPQIPPLFPCLTLKCAFRSIISIFRFLLLHGRHDPRLAATSSRPTFFVVMRSVCAARGRHASRTHLRIPDLGPKLPLSRLLVLCLPALCTRVPVIWQAASARRHRPRPPRARSRRFPARRATSACAWPPKPPTSPLPLSAAHHHVVGPRAVTAYPPSPTGTLLVASMAVADYILEPALLGVRRSRAGPFFGVFRACVAMSNTPL